MKPSPEQVWSYLHAVPNTTGQSDEWKATVDAALVQSIANGDLTAELVDGEMLFTRTEKAAK